MKQAWLRLTVFFLSGARFFTIKENMFVKAEQFSLGSSVLNKKFAFLT